MTCSTDNRNVVQPSDTEISENDTEDEDENQSNSDEISKGEEQGDGVELESEDKATLNSFTKPLSVIFQLSGYEHLLRLYWTLVTLPVTSCSAERVLCRLKLSKTG